MLLDPTTKSEIFIKLYRNVKNSKELKKKLTGQEIKGCLIRCSLILDSFQIIIAANKALASEKMTTKSIYTEILFNLSITKNISKSLISFSVQEYDECFLAVYFNEESGEALHKQITGNEAPLSDLKDLNDVTAIKKYYKISDIEAKTIPLLDSIVSRIATKDFLSH